jgi:hypothetical protein
MSELFAVCADTHEGVNGTGAQSGGYQVHDAIDAQQPSHHIIANIIAINKTDIDKRGANQKTHGDINVVKIAFYGHNMFPRSKISVYLAMRGRPHNTGSHTVKVYEPDSSNEFDSVTTLNLTVREEKTLSFAVA